MTRPQTLIVCSHGKPNNRHPLPPGRFEDCRTEPVDYLFTDEEVEANRTLMERALPGIHGDPPRPRPKPSFRGPVIRWSDSDGTRRNDKPRTTISSYPSGRGHQFEIKCTKCRVHMRMSEETCGQMLDRLYARQDYRDLPRRYDGTVVVLADRVQKILSELQAPTNFD